MHSVSRQHHHIYTPHEKFPLLLPSTRSTPAHPRGRPKQTQNTLDLTLPCRQNADSYSAAKPEPGPQQHIDTFGRNRATQNTQHIPTNPRRRPGHHNPSTHNQTPSQHPRSLSPAPTYEHPDQPSPAKLHSTHSAHTPSHQTHPSIPAGRSTIHGTGTHTQQHTCTCMPTCHPQTVFAAAVPRAPARTPST